MAKAKGLSGVVSEGEGFSPALLEILKRAETPDKGSDFVPTYKWLIKNKLPALKKWIKESLMDSLLAARGAGKTNVVVLGCGGTFQSKKTPEGYRPTGSLKESFEALQLPNDLTLDINLFDIMCVDSSQMNLQDHWRFLAEALILIQDECQDLLDGFIVTHGTDTMVEGAISTSMMLQGFPCSIIFTGSQHPATEEGTDAKQKMQNALELLKLSKKSGVVETMIACGNAAYRAAHARKIADWSANAFGAFFTPQEHPRGVDWKRAFEQGTAVRLDPALVSFQTSKQWEFSGFARKLEDIGPRRYFTNVASAPSLKEYRLTGMSPADLLKDIVRQEVSMVTQLGAGTSNDELAKVVVSLVNERKLVIGKVAFPDSESQIGKYAAGATLGSSISGLSRSIPMINGNDLAIRVKHQILWAQLGMAGAMSNHRDFGPIFDRQAILNYWSFMQQSQVGEYL